MTDDSILFDVATPFGFRVRTTRSYWDMICTVKHPVMRGREARVQRAVESPSEVRRSRSDPHVLLFYRQEGRRRWTCAVVRQVDGSGFLITAYLTDAIKEGERIWSR